jgi:hypothetical protein
MKKCASIFVVLFVLGFSSAVNAQEAKQDFTIVNKTGVVINELYVAPSESDEWEEDVLGRDALDVDEECDIQFHAKEDVCKWDLKIADEDGNYLYWENIDLCKWSKITLHWDGEKGTAKCE